MKYNPELNLNTILQTIVIAVMSYIGFIAVQAKDDITKLSAQQASLTRTMEGTMTRIEIELKLEALRLQIESVRLQCQDIETEVIKVKNLFSPTTPK